MDDINRYGVLEWNVTLSEVLEAYGDILNTPFDWKACADSDQYRPISEFMPAMFPSPFSKEVVLTNRLVTTVFFDLHRCQKYIIKKHEENPSWYPAEHALTFTEVGMGMVRNVTAGIPDRATVWTTGYIAPGYRTPGTYCPGDIKCAHKFQGSWRQYLDLEKRTAKGVGPLKDEYKKVMAQLNFYMTSPGGQVGFNQTLRYGYVITDQEVVLIRREPVDGSTPETSGYQLYASRGFPLRMLDVEAPEEYISGMLALLYIHLLAGKHHQQEGGWKMRRSGAMEGEEDRTPSPTALDFLNEGQ